MPNRYELLPCTEFDPLQLIDCETLVRCKQCMMWSGDMHYQKHPDKSQASVCQFSMQNGIMWLHEYIHMTIQELKNSKELLTNWF